MSSLKSNRPQNLHPDALLSERQEAARRNEEAVCVAVRAIQRRKTDPEKITVRAVAMESGVSEATIYRRDKLFALVQKVNPRLQRRRSEQVRRDDLDQSAAESAEALKERNYYQEKAELAILGSEQQRQEIIQLRKMNLELQSRNKYLEDQLAQCTCERKGPRPAS